MLTKRVIPCLDIKDGKVVKGVRFQNLRIEGDPVALSVDYEKQGADEIIFLDVTASKEARKIVLDLASRTAENLFIPFTVGGGIRSAEDMRQILSAGADKITVNTSSVRNPKILSEGAEVFGSQCVVLAVDAKRVYVEKDEPGRRVVETEKGPCWWSVYIEGGTIPTDLDALEWCVRAEKLGAGEVLLTSMDFDGTQLGYDIDLTRAVTELVNIPVIASGGAGKPEHLLQVLVDGKADAALAASIFHESIYSVSLVKRFLSERGVPVRLE